MEARKEFDVIKLMHVVTSTKNKNELIFKDVNGKLYFIDKKKPDGYNSLSPGDILLTWVVKEFETIGYVRVMIDGITVLDFVKNLPQLPLSYYRDIINAKMNDDIKLSNYFYNHDINFNKYLSSEEEFELTESGRALHQRYDAYGINSEKDEFIAELTVLHGYLYNNYSTIEI